VWELKQRTVIDMAADRGAFIDQSQSLNVHMPAPNFGKVRPAPQAPAAARPRARRLV
jgi:ribonucleotide reductase alpha subunit